VINFPMPAILQESVFWRQVIELVRYADISGDYRQQLAH
jgi:hypothetical protein